MPLGVWQGVAQDESGNAISGATVYVRNSSGALIGLFSDRGGAEGISNPFLSDESGRIKFYAEAQRIFLRVESGVDSDEWEDVIIIDDYTAMKRTDEDTGTRTLALVDNEALIVNTDSGALDITVPPNTDVDFPLFATIYFHQSAGAGTITLIAGSGVSLLYPDTVDPSTIGPNATIAVKQIAVDEWIVVGQLAAAA